ncbi:uncharacterized protein LOC144342898 [Saccoglossus kowalevskii]
MKKIVWLLVAMVTLTFLINACSAYILPQFQDNTVSGNVEDDSESMAIDPSSRLLEILYQDGFEEAGARSTENEIDKRRGRKVLQVCIDWKKKTWKWCYFDL